MAVIDELVPEETVAAVDEELDRLIASSGEKFAIDLRDGSYGPAFRRYLLFTRWPSLLDRAGIMVPAREALYNAYYWMLKFSKLHALKSGYDAGIEQQVFKLLEDPGLELDWEVIERISQLVDEEVG